MATWTIEDFVQHPKKSAAVLNASGTKALFTLSQYSIEKKGSSGGIYILDIYTGKETCILDCTGARDTYWVNETSFLYVNDQHGLSSLCLRDYRYASSHVVHQFEYAIGKLVYHSSGNLAFSVKVKASGSPLTKTDFDALEAEQVLVYEQGPLRLWDEWVRDFKYAIFTTKLVKDDLSHSLTSFVNVVTPHGLILEGWQTPEQCTFDVSSKHVAFTTRNSACDGYVSIAYQIWQITLDGQHAVQVYGAPGLCMSSSYSPAGDRLAFTIQKEAYNIGDLEQLMLYDVDSEETHQPVVHTWDRSVDSVTWSRDGSSVFLGTEHVGHQCIFQVHLDSPAQTPHLIRLDADAISEAINGTFLFSGSNFMQQRVFEICHASNPRVLRELTAGTSTMPQDSFVSEIWTKCDDRNIHSFLVKPFDFDSTKRYPMVISIHGGPQTAWLKTWSIGCNAWTIANAGTGRVVLLINPTGSTSYGRKFSNSIRGNWGSLPFQDICATFDQVISRFDFIDPARCIAWGGSYGGYMINWIQGHDFAKKFQALICECGIVDTYMHNLSMDKAYCCELGHSLAQGKVDRGSIDEHNPINLTDNWVTPQLILHGAKDFRVPETQAMAAYAILQAKKIPCRYIHWENEHHNVLKPENTLRRYREIVAWIERWTSNEDWAIL